jgi:hypothetical protein
VAVKTNGKAHSTTDQSAVIAQLMAEIAALKANNGPRELTFKLAQAGGLSVYGLQRMPVTLFKSQWERLLEQKNVEKMRAILADPANKFAVKGNK